MCVCVCVRVCVCACVCVCVCVCVYLDAERLHEYPADGEACVCAHLSLFFQLQALKGVLMNGEWILGPQQSGLLVNRCSTLGAERGRRRMTSNMSLCKNGFSAAALWGVECVCILQPGLHRLLRHTSYLLLLHLHSSSPFCCASTTPAAPRPQPPPS